MEWMIVVVVVAVAVVAVVQWLLERERRETWLLEATKAGLDYSRKDPFNTLTLPFGLFKRGRGRGVENVVWGTWDGVDVRVFDYWYYTESTDSKGNRSRTYHRFTCGLTPVTVEWPHLLITRETVLSRLGDFVGFRDIQFESDEFNRAFQVKSSDRRFASYVVDPRMMQWLLDGGQGWSFEIHAGNLLVWSKRVRAGQFHSHIARMAGFLRAVPAVAHEVYGAGQRG